MSAHIIGRPHDDLLDILLGHGADPEQALIGGRLPYRPSHGRVPNGMEVRVVSPAPSGPGGRVTAGGTPPPGRRPSPGSPCRSGR